MTSTTNDASLPAQPHAFKLTTDYISPINAVMVASLTLVDLATPALDRHEARIYSIVLGACVLLLLWALARAYRRRPAGTDHRWVLKRLVASKAVWISVVALVVGFGVLFWKDANASTRSRGVAASVVPGLDTLQNTMLGIRDDTSAIRGDTSVIRSDTTAMKSDLQTVREALAPADARGQLRTLGFGLDDESKARAIEACDLAALKLYVAAGEKFPIAVPAFGTRGGSVLEKPIIARDDRLPEVLGLLAARGMGFDQLRQKVAPPLRLGMMPSIVSANALTLALWFDNRSVAKKLIDLGADRTVGVTALLPKTDNRGNMIGGLGPVPVASAESEAKRLRRSDWMH